MRIIATSKGYRLPGLLDLCDSVCVIQNLGALAFPIKQGYSAYSRIELRYDHGAQLEWMVGEAFTCMKERFPDYRTSEVEIHMLYTGSDFADNHGVKSDVKVRAFLDKVPTILEPLKAFKTVVIAGTGSSKRWGLETYYDDYCSQVIAKFVEILPNLIYIDMNAMLETTKWKGQNTYLFAKTLENVKTQCSICAAMRDLAGFFEISYAYLNLFERIDPLILRHQTVRSRMTQIENMPRDDYGNPSGEYKSARGQLFATMAMFTAELQRDILVDADAVMRSRPILRQLCDEITEIFDYYE